MHADGLTGFIGKQDLAIFVNAQHGTGILCREFRQTGNFLLGQLAFGDIDQHAFIVQQLAMGVANGARIVQRKDDLTILPF